MLCCKWLLVGTIAIFCEKGSKAVWPMIEGEGLRVVYRAVE